MSKLLLTCICLVIAMVAAWPIVEPAVAKYRDAEAIAERGFVPRVLFREDGTRNRYVVFVPHLPPQKEDGRYPVLMFLNGTGENGNDGIKQISNNFGRQIWELKGSFPFIGVAPQCGPRGTWSGHGPETITAMRILDQVLADYDTDPDRVYLTGVSSGGTGVLNIATAYPDRFAAIVPIAADIGAAEQWANDLATAGMPVWSFYNGGDKRHVVDTNRAFRQAMVHRGMSPIFSEYDRLGHDAWNFALRNPAMYNWLLRQSMTRREQRDAFKTLIDNRLSKWQPSKQGNWIASDELIQFESSGSKQDQGERYLMLQEPLQDFDLHFDYRSAGNPHLELIVRPDALDSDSSDQQYRIVIASPHLGSGGVISRPDGNWLAFGDPAGQVALRPHAWNDVRLRRQDGKLNVEVNGWGLIDMEESAGNIGRGPVTIGLVGNATFGDEPSWREIRCRRLSTERGPQ